MSKYDGWGGGAEMIGTKIQANAPCVIASNSITGGSEWRARYSGRYNRHARFRPCSILDRGIVWRLALASPGRCCCSAGGKSQLIMTCCGNPERETRCIGTHGARYSVHNARIVASPTGRMGNQKCVLASWMHSLAVCIRSFLGALTLISGSF